MIAGIFLAAGLSERFGAEEAKLLLKVRGKSLLHYSLDACVASELPVIHVVLGRGARNVHAEIDNHFGAQDKLRVVWNESPENGMMSSVKCGINSIDARYDGAMIVLADMPGISANLINTLMVVYEKEKKIVIPQHEERLRHPRVIPRRLFAEFLELDDDGTGATVIAAHSDDILPLKIGDTSMYVDIDVPEDLEAFSKMGEQP